MIIELICAIKNVLEIRVINDIMDFLKLLILISLIYFQVSYCDLIEEVINRQSPARILREYISKKIDRMCPRPIIMIKSYVVEKIYNFIRNLSIHKAELYSLSTQSSIELQSSSDPNDVNETVFLQKANSCKPSTEGTTPLHYETGYRQENLWVQAAAKAQLNESLLEEYEPTEDDMELMFRRLFEDLRCFGYIFGASNDSRIKNMVAEMEEKLIENRKKNGDFKLSLRKDEIECIGNQLRPFFESMELLNLPDLLWE
ncbi:hypothetical protein ACOME3_002661 [Neoechinorhynchus agilis]